MSKKQISLHQQIEAVEWVESQFENLRKLAKKGMRDSEADRLVEGLKAAAESLRILEHGSLVAR